MKHYRYTIKELKEFTDYELLQRICLERESTCTNVYSPLSNRLQKLRGKLDRGEKLTGRKIK